MFFTTGKRSIFSIHLHYKIFWWMCYCSRKTQTFDVANYMMFYSTNRCGLVSLNISTLLHILMRRYQCSTLCPISVVHHLHVQSLWFIIFMSNLCGSSSLCPISVVHHLPVLCVCQPQLLQYIIRSKWYSTYLTYIQYSVVFFQCPANVRPFPNCSTFYGVKYFTSLYNSMLNCPEDKMFRSFRYNISQWLMAWREHKPWKCMIHYARQLQIQAAW